MPIKILNFVIDRISIKFKIIYMNSEAIKFFQKIPRPE